ncbi:hypothetical protein [Hafnia paralvei]|uniref:hypothetical protein n=1 Tax=Hafnia paralvei TaxID=546367 RepID=UPI00241E0617|nr:hypothetical protein [Hafnia paralvei]
MTCAHCICPEFVNQHIGDPEVFTNVFIGRFLQTEDQVILDSEGKLIYKYVETLQGQQSKYEVFKVWRMLLEGSNNGKLLLTSSSVNDDVQGLVYDVTVRANTTFNKDIVAFDNNHYGPFISELTRQRIQLLNLQNLTSQIIGRLTNKNVNYFELDYDLAWVLQRLSRRATRAFSEDESNDYIRDMMLSKHYEVKDQTREGESSSGQQAGELDLIIEDSGNLFSIIEAMKLTSLNTNYIKSHYKKLLDNYNPLLVKRVFLVTYYEGARFDEWWGRYCLYINSLDNDELDLDLTYEPRGIQEIETPYMGLRKLEHHFMYGDEHFACIHYAVKIAR